jgi:Uma2 family endonuclease
MSPDPDNQHQELGADLRDAIKQSLDSRAGVRVFHGTNVSDRAENWSKNFRVPDVAVFLPGNPAEDRDTHWYGGPDFVIEVRSRGDRSLKKTAFYASVGVREFLLVDRRPWTLKLFRLVGQALRLVGESNRENAAVLSSQVLPLTFQLLDAEPRPKISLRCPGDGRGWLL